jgi:hypothetical protein
MSGELTTCFPGDLSKISHPIFYRKEQEMPTERVSTTVPLNWEIRSWSKLPQGGGLETAGARIG